MGMVGRVVVIRYSYIRLALGGDRLYAKCKLKVIPLWVALLR